MGFWSSLFGIVKRIFRPSDAAKLVSAIDPRLLAAAQFAVNVTEALSDVSNSEKRERAKVRLLSKLTEVGVEATGRAVNLAIELAVANRKGL